jgi:hypothetical protein
MNVDTPMTHEDFVDIARAAIEEQLDAAIIEERDPHVRRVMMFNRETILGKAVDAVAIGDLKRRLGEAEERRFRVVQCE